MAFEIKKTYNFTTLVPSLLGGEYKNMQVVSLMTPDEAVKYQDILTLHEQVRTLDEMLKAICVVSANDCTYVKFKTLEGDTKIIALEYIEPDSIKEVTTVNIRIELQRATTEDISIITARLKELGYVDFDVTTYI